MLMICRPGAELEHDRCEVSLRKLLKPGLAEQNIVQCLSLPGETHSTRKKKTRTVIVVVV